jgi:class 3 adenylate cyclase
VQHRLWEVAVELEVRFFRMTNGARIAYTSIGNGPPLVIMPAAITHLQIGWEGPNIAEQYRSLAESFTVIWYDRWGMGLSDRKRDDWTLDGEVQTLGQLVDHLGLEKAAIWGISGGGPACIKYAAEHPSRVSQVILYATYSRRTDIDAAWLAGFEEFVRKTWQMGAGALAEVVVPNSSPEVKNWFLRLCREGADGESWANTADIELLADVRAEAKNITAPTLVIHRRDDPGNPFESGIELAAEIPGARFLPLEGNEHMWMLGDPAPVVQAIKAFAGVESPPLAAPSNDGSPSLQTIFFSDLEGHTAMMSRLGDARGRELLREHERLTREALRAHGGREVKAMGDGFIASFGSAQRALECAIALQQAISDPACALAGERVGVRVGINAGEPIAEDGDLFGASVIAAARIAAKATGGQVLASDVVRQLVAGKGFLFSDTGEHDLKGLEDPVRLWELRWQS